MATARRELTFLLAGPERRVLHALARRLPAWVRANHLTGIGVLGALGAATAYALAGQDPVWLWVASVMIWLNWFGDSLDGTLARVRQVERPRYGYYLDHIVDAFSTAAVGIGIGLSQYVRIELALLLVVVYLALSINVYLESSVFGVFRLAYGRLGPTEARVLLMVANAVLALSVGPNGAISPVLMAFTNGVAAVLVAAMIVTLAIRFAGNLRALARMEPASAHRR